MLESNQGSNMNEITKSDDIFNNLSIPRYNNLFDHLELGIDILALQSSNDRIHIITKQGTIVVLNLKHSKIPDRSSILFEFIMDNSIITSLTDLKVTSTSSSSGYSILILTRHTDMWVYHINIKENFNNMEYEYPKITVNMVPDNSCSLPIHITTKELHGQDLSFTSTKLSLCGNFVALVFSDCSVAIIKILSEYNSKREIDINKSNSYVLCMWIIPEYDLLSNNSLCVPIIEFAYKLVPKLNNSTIATSIFTTWIGINIVKMAIIDNEYINSIPEHFNSSDNSINNKTQVNDCKVDTVVFNDKKVVNKAENQLLMKRHVLIQNINITSLYMDNLTGISYVACGCLNGYIYVFDINHLVNSHFYNTSKRTNKIYYTTILVSSLSYTCYNNSLYLCSSIIEHSENFKSKCVIYNLSNDTIIFELKPFELIFSLVMPLVPYVYIFTQECGYLLDFNRKCWIAKLHKSPFSCLINSNIGITQYIDHFNQSYFYSNSHLFVWIGDKADDVKHCLNSHSVLCCGSNALLLRVYSLNCNENQSLFPEELYKQMESTLDHSKNINNEYANLPDNSKECKLKTYPFQSLRKGNHIIYKELALSGITPLYNQILLPDKEYNMLMKERDIWNSLE